MEVARLIRDGRSLRNFEVCRNLIVRTLLQSAFADSFLPEEA